MSPTETEQVLPEQEGGWRLWLHSLKVAQLLRSAACLHTNQSRSYLNLLVIVVYFEMRFLRSVKGYTGLDKIGSEVGEGRGVHRVLVGKPEGKRPLGRPRRRWEDNIRWIFRKWEGVVRTGWSWLRIGTGGGHL